MKRPHQKAHKISDMTEEERLELADKIEAELPADVAAYARTRDLSKVDVDEVIEGDVVISGSGNIFADLGLENAEELKAMADKMIAEGIPEDQIVSALQSITPNDGEMGEDLYAHLLELDEIRKTK